MTAQHVAPRLIDTKRGPHTVYKASPLYRPLVAVQDEGLNIVGVYGSAIKYRREFEDYDGQSDAIIREVIGNLRARGDHYSADRLELALHLDHQERGPLDRIWKLFGAAAEAGRQIVHAINKMLGRGGR